jgi:hypothetical protein
VSLEPINPGIVIGGGNETHGDDDGENDAQDNAGDEPELTTDGLGLGAAKKGHVARVGSGGHYPDISSSAMSSFTK